MDPDIKCIRMWSEPLLNFPGVEFNTVVLLMDTNGLMNPEDDKCLDLFMYQFAMKVSSVMIINVQRYLSLPVLSKLLELGKGDFPLQATLVIRDRSDHTYKEDCERWLQEYLIRFGGKLTSCSQMQIPIATLPFPGVMSQSLLDNMCDEFKSRVGDLYRGLFRARRLEKQISWSASLLLDFMSHSINVNKITH